MASTKININLQKMTIPNRLTISAIGYEETQNVDINVQAEIVAAYYGMSAATIPAGALSSQLDQLSLPSLRGR